MFEKFGEMDSAAEISELAENLFNEGDTESIYALAAENGLDRAFAEAYIAGDTAELCDAMTAALGKLQAERAEMKPEGLMEDWVTYIEAQCITSDEMAEAVRRKGKSIKGVIAELLRYSFTNRRTLPDDIKKAAGISASRVDFGIPGMKEAKRIIRDYYLGGDAK